MATKPPSTRLTASGVEEAVPAYLSQTAECLEVCFDDRVYRLISVKKAAYRFINEFSADISLQAGQIRCVLNRTPTSPGKGLSQIAEDFKKEVLDQDLRETLKAETEPVRNLILAHAFSRTGLISREQVPED